ncbi:MAG: 8-amino-7-oxononanoate synthase [Isosphaeraceae bacterium]|nr:8-amino-7-oxononanoate synthase [Isosphaeraceae bacterium]
MPDDPLSWIDEESAHWSSRGLARRLRARGGAGPGLIVVGGQTLVHFGSNDYLALAGDPRVVEAARSAAAFYGWGAGASPLIAGWTEAHQALADDLARFERTDAVALFPTGFAANLGTIAALVGKEDAIYSDRLNHACLIDGARLSRATLRVYPHNDADRLDALLARDQGRFRRSLIATDGVFSMDGDLAPLGPLADLAERFGAMLLVDEAHGTGVFGPDGRGAAAACGVAERVAVRVGTLSKSLGSVGGFVAGSQRLIDWLVNHARTLIYSTGLPAAAAAAAREALAIARAEPWRREQVVHLGDRLRAHLKGAGIEVGGSTGAIVPVLIGASDDAVSASERLRAAGFFVPAIRPPTVPDGTARLRISLTAAHTDEQVERVGRLLAEGY